MQSYEDQQNLGNRVVKLIHDQPSDERKKILQELLDKLIADDLNPYEVINVLNLQNETPSEGTHTCHFGMSVMEHELASTAEIYMTLLNKLRSKDSDISSILLHQDKQGRHLGHYIAFYQSAEIMRYYLRVLEAILNENSQLAPQLREILTQSDHHGYTVAHAIAQCQDSDLVQRMIRLMNQFAQHEPNRWLFDDVLNKGIRQFNDKSQEDNEQEPVYTLSHFIAARHDASTMKDYIDMLSRFQNHRIIKSEEASALLTLPNPEGINALSYTVERHNDGQIVYDVCQKFSHLEHQYEKLANAKEALANHIKSLDWNVKGEALNKACGATDEHNNLHQVFLVARPKALLPKNVVTWFSTPGLHSGWLKALNDERKKMEPTASVYSQNRYNSYQPHQDQQNGQHHHNQSALTQRESDQHQQATAANQDNEPKQKKTYKEVASSTPTPTPKQ